MKAFKQEAYLSSQPSKMTEATCLRANVPLAAKVIWRRDHSFKSQTELLGYSHIDFSKIIFTTYMHGRHSGNTVDQDYNKCLVSSYDKCSKKLDFN